MTSTGVSAADDVRDAAGVSAPDVSCALKRPGASLRPGLCSDERPRGRDEGKGHLPRLVAHACGALIPLLFLAGCASSVAAPQTRTRTAFETQCEARVPRGEVSVTAIPMDPRIETSVSYRDLTQRAGKDGYVWVLGLTQPTLRVQAQWGFTGLTEQRSGRSCIRPTLKMTLRYDPVTVFIGREFVDDACAYGFIFQHEMRHVAVHVRKLREVSERLQRDLSGHLAGKLHYGTRSALEKRLRAEIDQVWMPRAERDLKDVRREHQTIDSPEEYARAKTVCDGSIARYLSKTRAAAGG